ncbi:MAG: hypothetical protein VX738_00895 [Planctomycetota bacterium]|nr:hypothetical protein [Planctomycetota bacterium]
MRQFVTFIASLSIVCLLCREVFTQERILPSITSSALGGVLESGKKASEDHSYIRIEREQGDSQTPLSLQTAIVKFKANRGPYRKSQVDLIGAIHIADAAYYHALNKRFKEYDVVLYELVAPEGVEIEQGHKQELSLDVISGSQQGFQAILGLSHQIEEINYQADNFVHADMTPTEFNKHMSDRGESFMQLYFRSIGQGMALQGTDQGSTSDLGLLFALFSSDREYRMKLIMAKQFERMEGLPDVLSGPEGSTIITLRNDKALSILKEQLKEGHRKIGIFYGAGHFDDMEQKLVNEFHLQRFDEEWVDAWNLRRAKKQ